MLVNSGYKPDDRLHPVSLNMSFLDQLQISVFTSIHTNLSTKYRLPIIDKHLNIKYKLIRNCCCKDNVFFEQNLVYFSTKYLSTFMYLSHLSCSFLIPLTNNSFGWLRSYLIFSLLAYLFPRKTSLSRKDSLLEFIRG